MAAPRADEVPPLPVAVELRRERANAGCFGSHEDAERRGRLTAGPGRVPEDAREAEHRPAPRSSFFTRRAGSSSSTRPPARAGASAASSSRRSPAHRRRRRVHAGRIDPHVPVVLDRAGPRADDRANSAAGPRALPSRHAQVPKRRAVANRDRRRQAACRPRRPRGRRRPPASSAAAAPSSGAGPKCATSMSASVRPPVVNTRCSAAPAAPCPCRSG